MGFPNKMLPTRVGAGVVLALALGVSAAATAADRTVADVRADSTDSCNSKSIKTKFLESSYGA